MTSSSVSIFKFVGTVSLGLLTGVSYTVSTFALPSLLNLPTSSGASQALSSLNSYLRLPVLALSTLAAAPFLVSFALSPRTARHPYLLYTSLLAVLSVAAPNLLLSPPATTSSSRSAESTAAKKAAAPRPARNLEASYEVLGDVHSEAPSEEEIEEVGTANGEEVRSEVEWLARCYVVRTGFTALAFAMAVVGIWGDGAPQAVVYMS